ncbi:thiamine diphosphokinase [Bacillus shivajii]|uniref:thiamine diphosphokinase n=1 Tax=Bacillus shivajii TaxID=1983719 RepID=UPI001CFA05CA|nr:thiamine diphosphokinase [Bacillus shivajii]UCZ51779.1 thiamine diphosphokinase [Bacillus shivajii]
MIYILFAGGPIENIPPVSEIQRIYGSGDVKWIGVDRGVYYLLKENTQPDYAFGDFDSLSKEEKEWVDEYSLSLKVYPEEKDETDLEIALSWVLLRQDVEKVIIFGGTGGRLDHLFMNTQLLLKGLELDIPVILEDRSNRMFMKKPGSYTLTNSEANYISFLPMSKKVKGLTLTGFRYPLKEKEVVQGSSLCISNELRESQGSYSFKEGILMVFESSDHMHS